MHNRFFMKGGDIKHQITKGFFSKTVTTTKRINAWYRNSNGNSSTDTYTVNKITKLSNQKLTQENESPPRDTKYKPVRIIKEDSFYLTIIKEWNWSRKSLCKANFSLSIFLSHSLCLMFLHWCYPLLSLFEPIHNIQLFSLLKHHFTPSLMRR